MIIRVMLGQPNTETKCIKMSSYMFHLALIVVFFSPCRTSTFILDRPTVKKIARDHAARIHVVQPLYHRHVGSVISYNVTFDALIRSAGQKVINALDHIVRGQNSLITLCVMEIIMNHMQDFVSTSGILVRHITDNDGVMTRVKRASITELAAKRVQFSFRDLEIHSFIFQ